MIEILTREIPYPNKTISEIISAISNQQLPIEWNEEKWAANEEVKQFLIEKCFAFDPNQRSSFKVRTTTNLNNICTVGFQSIIFKMTKKEIVNSLENFEKSESTKVQLPVSTNQNEEYHDILQQTNQNEENYNSLQQQTNQNEEK